MAETKRFYNVTREQFYGVFQSRDFYSGEAEPVAIIEHKGSLMQVEPYQVKFVEETETERKAKAFDEIVSYADEDNHFGEVSNNNPRHLEAFFKRHGGHKQ